MFMSDSLSLLCILSQASHHTTELAKLAGLASYFALGTLCLFLSTELLVVYHTHPRIYLEFKLPLFSFLQLCTKCLTHRAIS